MFVTPTASVVDVLSKAADAVARYVPEWGAVRLCARAHPAVRRGVRVRPAASWWRPI